MKLICTLTGAQVETSNDKAAEKLIASGGFVALEEQKPKRAQRKKAAPKEV